MADAMNWLRTTVLAPVSQGLEDPEIPVHPFLLRKGQEKKPSFFEIEFLQRGNRYRYGIELDSKRIHSEFLFRKRPKGREVVLFTREKQNIEINSNQYKEAKGLENRTKQDSLFLTVCASFDVKEAQMVIAWFRQFRFVSGLTELSFFSFTAKQLQEEVHQKRILEFARKADFQIAGLSSKLERANEENLPESVPTSLRRQLISKKEIINAEIFSERKVLDYRGHSSGSLKWDITEFESEGTQKFIALAGPILHTLEEGAILIIDEFEARLHPELTRAIVDWFQSGSNHTKAQLILTTHDVGLMTPDLLRRDQIWITEKDDTGHTSLKRLSDFDVNQVKPTTRFNKHYMMGLFGGRPNVALDEFRTSHLEPQAP
ncbi:ATP-binding protein [Roseibacillus ishigakijimensis]|uniref:ATP-binding protein n=1 Tax=Roseibacillus ishigakijimensis TaxID=454146 RepID=A0A934RTB3_9BACT|nr:ATP-binding protein [Roseibacillus ishigakijimensis]